MKHCTGYAEYQTVNKIERKMEESMAATNETLHRMKTLVEKLQEASKAYYAQDKEIMSNFEYDKLYE